MYLIGHARWCCALLWHQTILRCFVGAPCVGTPALIKAVIPFRWMRVLRFSTQRVEDRSFAGKIKHSWCGFSSKNTAVTHSFEVYLIWQEQHTNRRVNQDPWKSVCVRTKCDRPQSMTGHIKLRFTESLSGQTIFLHFTLKAIELWRFPSELCL